MNIVDDYWSMYDNRTFLFFFYERHALRCRRVLNAIKALSIIVTAIALSDFLVTGRWYWSVIILATQILTSLRDLWDVTKKEWALKYFSRDFEQLLLSMSSDWRRIEHGEVYFEDILEKIDQYEREYVSIRDKYISSFSFSEPRRYISFADDKASKTLNYRHPGGEMISAKSAECSKA